MTKKLKIFMSIIVLSFSCFISLYSDTGAKIQFIKGNIADKIAAVKQSSAQGDENLADYGLDFAIQSNKLIPNDRDISALAVASILAISSNDSSFSDKLITAFTEFNDETIKIAVINRLVTNTTPVVQTNVLNLLNSFLQTAIDQNQSAHEVFKTIIQALGSTGNSQSYSLVYTCWQKKLWPEYQTAIESSLVALAARNIADCVKTISSASSSDTRAFFSLITSHTNISSEIQSEIAENVLSRSIHSTDDLSTIDTDTVALQIAAVKTIAENNWTRAAPLVTRYFELAREEYNAHAIDLDQFIGIIQGMVKLASSDTAQVLNDYLAELNQKTEKNDYTDKSVLLAVIGALGTLGDKISFDTLLYVTYLNYPEEVISASREALSKLKW